MPDSGVAPELLGLPRGAGGVRGLGADFVPDLNTGGGNYAIPLDVPDGVDGHSPRLVLQYATGHANGPFGLGWSLPTLRIERAAEERLPRYDAADRLTLPGAGPLVELSDGRLVPETDGLGQRIRRSGDGFELTERSGVRHQLGTTAAARIADPGDPTRVYAWLLERSSAPAGQTIDYVWAADGAQRLLKSVAWAAYRVEFNYADRPDPVLDGRPGFLLRTTQRCTSVGLHVTSEAATLIRSWELSYAAGEPTAHSLLANVQHVGHGSDGSSATLPPLRLRYTALTAADARLDPVAGASLLERPAAMLADLSGDGLADIVDLGGGRITVARNRGGLTFDPPRAVDARGVPGLASDVGLFAGDVGGRGRVDLCSLQSGLGYRYPVEGDATIGRPVVSPAAPSARPGESGVRLLDADGDAATDIVSIVDGVLSVIGLHAAGWERTEQRHVGPELVGVDTTDNELLVAPIKGDGLADLVRVRSGEVRFWPALGHARWGQPRTIADSPVLPHGFRRERLLLVDIDGDGCADLVYLDDDRLRVWCNRGGDRFEPERVIGPIPGLASKRVDAVDLAGAGIGGLLLSIRRGGRDLPVHAALGRQRPYLLTEIDNGLGHVVDVTYGSSVEEARRDRMAGTPWRTFLPFAVPVVTRLREHDAAGIAGSVSKISDFHYHDGCWDTALRRFIGFARVETVEPGDELMAGALTVTEFGGGRAAERVDQPPEAAERLRAQVLRGRIDRTRLFAEGADPAVDPPLLQVHNSWRADVAVHDGALVATPRLIERREEHFDGAATPWRTTVTRNLAWDAYGNITEQEQRNELTADPAATETLLTTTTFATNAERFIVDRVARSVQRSGAGVVLDARITRYDGPGFVGLTEGEIGIGLVTSEQRLVLRDDVVADVYAASPPDFAGIGYHRVAGEQGWWVHTARLERPADDPTLLRSLDPRGGLLETQFDADGLFPIRRTDARGNVLEATRDARAARPDSMTDGNGGVARNRYDQLGRIIAELRPGDDLSGPTITYSYDLSGAHPVVETNQFPGAGRAERVTTRTLVGGDGERIANARQDSDGSWVVADAVVRNRRGKPARVYLPFRTVPAAEPTLPPPDAPHITTTFDALGRPLTTTSPSGAVRTGTHGAGASVLHDAEDNRVGGTHAGTPTTFALDAAGRVRSVESTNGASVLSTTYRYDLRNQPVAIADPAARTTRIDYDQLGHKLRVVAPAAGATVFVHDAAGNVVERRNGLGQRTVHHYDELNRRTRSEDPGSGLPDREYRYVDAAGAGGAINLTRRVGRLHQVIDSLGTTTLSYDARGEIETKVIQPAGGGPAFTIRRVTDQLRRMQAITYPAVGAAPPTRLRYRYDKRGLLAAIDGVIDSIRYDDVEQPVETVYTSGVRALEQRDDEGRVTHATVSAPGGAVLDEWTAAYDLVGNAASITGRTPQTSWTYEHDDLYQLTKASPGIGPALEYHFDGAGDMTFKTTVGNMHYGEGGAPAGCLTSAGAAAYGYDAIGRQTSAPAGTMTYDPQDRLLSLTHAGFDVELAYGAFDKPTRRTITDGATTAHTLMLDELVDLVDGQLVCSVTDGGRVLAQFSPGSVIAALHADHRGSTTLVTGVGGAVLRRLSYDPWGAVLEDSAPGDGDTPLYDGYRLLAAVGMYLTGSRVYDPAVGRFTTPDVMVSDLWHPVGLNAYAYAANNPVTIIDPDGRFWEYFAAVLLVVAVVALTIVTFGVGAISLGAMIGVFVAMGIGGAVGGIAAAQAGGDVALGILLGAAIAGGAALAGAVAGAGLAAVFGKAALITHLLGGAISGALLGAATGFAAGWAGGAGDLGEIWKKTWQGALLGFAIGAAFGLASYGFQQGLFGTGRLSFHGPAEGWTKAGSDAARDAARAAGEAANAGKGAAEMATSAATSGATNLASSLTTFGGASGFPVLEALVFNPIAQTLVVGGNGAILALDYFDDLWKIIQKLEPKAKKEGTW